MQVKNIISPNKVRKTLKDFIPLVFAFFCGLIILSLYQNIRLYYAGVLDSFLNKSFLLLIMHHSGFAAFTALVLAFLFNYLERKKPNFGFNTTKIVFVVLILIEALLIEHYIHNYEPLGFGRFSLSKVLGTSHSILPILIVFMLTVFLFHLLYKVTKSFYDIVSRMYPFTIVLIGLFLATLNSVKKPINENKTQHYVKSAVDLIFDFNKYEGDVEYPLLKEYKHTDNLGSHMMLKDEKPNIIVIIIEGLGSDFVGKNAIFKGFTPFLESLTKRSLYWENNLSNTGESFASFPTIIGSLPFGVNGFTNLKGNTNRLTMLSLLKENGYTTSFNYGGNSALNGLDKFLDEEHVDEILDKKGFGDGYQLQEEDAAGITLGFPDKELFRKWNSEVHINDKPRFDIFLTLSTKNPFLIPDLDSYKNKVDKILSTVKIDKRAKKLVNKNKEVFASLIYADNAIKEFLDSFKAKSNYDNTIFIITGSHNLKDIPQDNTLARYRVPLLVYSSMLKSPKSIKSLVSHADITPSMISMLDQKYGLQIPQQVAWLGNDLLPDTFFESSKQIPLFRDKRNIQDYIHEDLFVSNGSVYQMNENLELLITDDEIKKNKAINNFKYFKAVNKYVTKNNKILPESEALYANVKNEFTKAQLVWVQSVFNGNDFDNAYKIARKLAFDQDWERSLLLCNYILSKIPRHADTEVLIGRIHSWKKDYDTSISVLSEAIRKYPTYTDAYSALLDTYFWADQNERVTELNKIIKRKNIYSLEIDEKLNRAHQQIKKQELDSTEKQIKKEESIVLQ